MSAKKLIEGDIVVMHSCGEAEFHDGTLWKCTTNEHKLHRLHTDTVVFLEGFSGAFLTKYLQRVNIK